MTRSRDWSDVTPKARNANSLQKPEETRNRVSPGASRRNQAC